jgi:hypothetical protein
MDEVFPICMTTEQLYDNSIVHTGRLKGKKSPISCNNRTFLENMIH